MTSRRSPRKAGGRRRGTAVTPAPACPGPVLLVLSHHCCCSAGQRHLGAGRRLAACVLACMLILLAASPQHLCVLLTSTSPGGHLCCSGKSSTPSPAGTRLTVPRETSYCTGGSGSKRLCFSWNWTPGTGFFLQRQTLAPVHQVQGQPGALPSASSLGPGLSEPGSRLRQSPPLHSHILRTRHSPYPPLQGPRVRRAGPVAASQEAE